jgi:hypothetical protein
MSESVNQERIHGTRRKARPATRREMVSDAGSSNTASESPHVVISLLESFLTQGKNDST